MKFEVGKTYKKHTGGKTKCLAVVESKMHGPCILMEDSDFALIWTFYLQDYERGDVVKMSEYKEPTIHKAQLCWFRSPDGIWVLAHPITRYKVGQKLGESTVVHVQEVEYEET